MWTEEAPCEIHASKKDLNPMFITLGPSVSKLSIKFVKLFHITIVSTKFVSQSLQLALLLEHLLAL